MPAPVSNEKALPVSVTNQNTNFKISAPIILELYDSDDALIATVTGYYAVDLDTARATLWIPPLEGVATASGDPLTITGEGGADLPAVIQLSEWVDDVDVVVSNNDAKAVGVLGRATDGTFSLAVTGANFTIAKTAGIPNPIEINYPIPDMAQFALELQTAIEASGFATITEAIEFLDELKTALAANTFATITEMVEEVARFRDHGLTDNE